MNTLTAKQEKKLRPLIELLKRNFKRKRPDLFLPKTGKTVMKDWTPIPPISSRPKLKPSTLDLGRRYAASVMKLGEPSKQPQTKDKGKEEE